MMKKYFIAVLSALLMICQGTMVVYGSEENIQTLLQECETFENGSEVKFQNDDEWMQFAYFYVNDYELNRCKIRYQINGNSVRIADEGRYNRSNIVQEITQTFGPIPGNTSEEKISNTCQIVREKIKYNESYANSTLDTAIKDQQGVCWHIAKICAVLLRENGIPCETVYGYTGRNIQSHEITHMWLKCNTGAETIYIDPELGILPDNYYYANYKEIGIDEWERMVRG
jgi:hypothetical protein